MLKHIQFFDQSANASLPVAFNVVVIDNIAPVLNPVADFAFTANLNIALGTYDVLYTDVTTGPATDACGFGTQGILDGPGGTIVPFVTVVCTDALTETVWIGATDVNGNYTEAAVQINIVDPTPPIWNPVPNIIEPLDLGTCGAVVNYTITAADANCGPVTVVQIVPNPAVLQSGDIFPIGVTNVTMEATNTAGVTSTVSFTVEVFDDVDPMAVCNDITVVLDGTGNVTITANDVGSGSSDNCLPLTMTLDDYSFDCSDVGVNTVTLTVTEVLPVSSTTIPRTDTCTANVTVQDNQFPVLDAKATFYIALDLINGDGIINYNPDLVNSNATDNCLIATEGIDDDNNAGTPPVAFMTVDCASALASPLNVTVEATDQWGNRTTAIVVVTVEDTSVPVFNPVPDIIEPNDPGVCGAIVNYTISAADVNCAPVTVTQLSPVGPGLQDGDVFPIGDTVITMLATSTSGATNTVTFTITIQDLEAPTAVCQDITVQLDASGNASITAGDVDGGSFDNCGFTLGVTPNSFDCSDVGANTVTLTITDDSGLTNTCTATVTVEDNVAPVAVCSPYTLVLDANGDGSITAGDVDGGSADACGILSMSVSPDTFDCGDVGANTVTLTVTDVNGNVSTCTTTVTVADSTAPVAVCQDITVQLDANGDASITGADVDNGSADACGVASLSVSPSSFDCSDVGANTVTLTVTDVNGNASTCTATVTVEDNVAPTAVCNNFSVILDAIGSASITVGDVDGGSSDACGILSMSIDNSDFTCADIGDNNVVLTVTDVNGNVSTCTAIVTVVDNIPPLIACPADVTDNSDPDVCGAEVIYADASAIDICGIVSVVQISPDPNVLGSGDVFPIGTTTVTFRATDAGGNTTDCSFDITIVDLEAPVAVCQDLTISLDEFGFASITTGDINDGSTDNCPIDFMTLSQSTFGCDDVGDNTVTLTVFDLSGNSSSCSATVTVIDDIAPIIVCIGQPNSIVATEGFEGSSVPSGWTTEIVSGGWDWSFGSGDVPGAPDFATNAAIFDDDAEGGGGLNNVARLISPVYDISGSTSADLSFDYALGDFAGSGLLRAEVYDGSTWQEVFLVDNIDTPPTNTGMLDMMAYANAAFQVRFTYDDENSGWNWGAGVDNFSLEFANPATPLDVVLGDDGTIVLDASDLLLDVIEACDYTVTGPDGEMVTLDCSDLGLTEVEVTVTDASGNASSCIATVNVIDLTDPIITCVGPTTGEGSGSASDSPALAIPDGDPAGTTTTITVAEARDITDLNVDINITHTWVGDLTVTLTSPAGTEVVLIDRMGYTGSGFGCAGDDLDVTLDDEATDPIEDECGDLPAAGGPFTPNEALSAFDGESTAGVWTLFVSDSATPDPGTLNSWGIAYDYMGEPTDTFPIYLNEEGWVLVDPFTLIESTNEACGIDVAAADRVYFTCDDVGAGPILVTVFVSDFSGNLASCVAEIEVFDTIAPVLTCPEDQTQDPGQGNLFYELPDYLATGEATAIDNCTDPAITTQDPAPGTLLPDGVYTVSFTAADDSGNSSACEFTLTVESIILAVGDLNIGSVILYPNPASDHVMLSNPQSLVLDTLSIYDLTGRLVNTVDLTDMGSEIRVDVSKLASATYMVLIKGDNGQVSKSLIKD